VKDPAKTYKGLSYIVTTFRLKKRTIAESDVIEEALALGARTNALQFAVEQVFKDLHKLDWVAKIPGLQRESNSPGRAPSLRRAWPVLRRHCSCLG
jgi:hypothetical protein